MKECASGNQVSTPTQVKLQGHTLPSPREVSLVWPCCNKVNTPAPPLLPPASLILMKIRAVFFVCFFLTPCDA